MTEEVFDLDEDEFLKEVGKAKAVHNRSEVLAAGKRFAKLIALGRLSRIVNADDVYADWLMSIVISYLAYVRILKTGAVWREAVCAGLIVLIAVILGTKE